MNLFTSKKKTVAGITQSLTKIKTDLKILDEEKVEELKLFKIEKSEIELKIDNAEKEKEKGWVIFKNISNLLGDPITKVPVEKTKDK